MLLAAGATVLVGLGIVGIPLVNACAPAGSGLMACLRDMADRRFDLPGDPPPFTISSKSETPATAASPAPVTEPAALPDPVAENVEAGPTVSPRPEPETPAVVAGHEATVPSVTPPLEREATAPPAADVAPPAVEAPPVAEASPPAAEPVTAATGEGQGGPLLPPRRPETASPAVQPTKPAAPILREAALENTQVAPKPILPPSALPPASPEIDALVVAPVDEQPPLPTVAALPEPTSPPVATPAPATPSLPPIDPRPRTSGVDEPGVPAEEQSVAASEVPLAADPAPAVAAPVILAPTIDAIELEGPASYISGSGPNGATIRLYSDGKLLGESPVEEGRWLVEAGDVLGDAETELRVEAIEPDTGKSLGDSVITVEIERPEDRPAEPLPETTPPATSPADVPTTDAPAPPPVPATTDQPELPVVTPPTAPADDVPEPPTLPEPSLPADEPAENELSPQPTPDSAPAPVEAAPTPDQVAQPETQTEPNDIVQPDELKDLGPPTDIDLPRDTTASGTIDPPTDLPPLAAVVPDKGSASVELLPNADAELDALPPLGVDDHEPATIELDPPDAPALVAEFTLPEPEADGQSVTVLRLFPFGDPVYGRFSGGQAIIRRGDTLWSLARRYYGAGMHYHTIFDANRSQISRPSKIYPGQVFDLPLVTEE